MHGPLGHSQEQLVCKMGKLEVQAERRRGVCQDTHTQFLLMIPRRKLLFQWQPKEWTQQSLLKIRREILWPQGRSICPGELYTKSTTPRQELGNWQFQGPANTRTRSRAQVKLILTSSTSLSWFQAVDEPRGRYLYLILYLVSLVRLDN